MADFSVSVFPATIEAWGDPATTSRPSRINPLPGISPLRYRVAVNVEISLTCTVNGVAGPMDAALGGRLFTGFCLEHSSPGRPPCSHPVNQTSVQKFTPTSKGHYTVEIVRDGKMAVVVHMDAL